MQGRDDATEFIAGFAGDDRYVVDYLVEEVVQRQPEDVQDFLLQDVGAQPAERPAVRRGERRVRREGDAADARARQPLPRPARRPAPVVPLPPPLRRRPPGAAAGRGSPSWCRSCTVGRAGGTPTTASPRRRSGTRWPAGTSRAPRTWWSGACSVVRRDRQEAMLRSWLEALPEDVITRRPVLCNAYAGAMLGTAEVAGVEDRLRDAERWVDEMAQLGGDARPAGMVVVNEEELRRLPDLAGHPPRRPVPGARRRRGDHRARPPRAGAPGGGRPPLARGRRRR